MNTQKSDHEMVKGILLLYHRCSIERDAAAVTEHIEAFSRHSRFRVWSVNTEEGFPAGLGLLRFDVIILHYSLFAGWCYFLNQQFEDYLTVSSSSYKIAFFQDEYRYCRKRFDFVNQHKVDCSYTLVKPEYFKDTYRKYTVVTKLVCTIPGYVSDSLIDSAKRLYKPDPDRTIDVGYRGRQLEFFMGKGGQEKSAIASGFLDRAGKLKLKLDITCTEAKRLYGKDWYSFLAGCKAFLGVETGVSIFDTEDVVREECERILAANPTTTFDEIFEQVLAPWENKIYYRTIGPRHFEAAAFRVCQILFEGEYSGVLQPMVHYISLKKDFSNFDNVIQLLSDRAIREELTENAYRDLIASGRYSYARFIDGIDKELEEQGFKAGALSNEDRVSDLLALGSWSRKVKTSVWNARYYGNLLPVPLRKLLRPISRRLLHGNTDAGRSGTS